MLFKPRCLFLQCLYIITTLLSFDVAFAQKQDKSKQVDSLEKLINTDIPDTSIINILIQLHDLTSCTDSQRKVNYVLRASENAEKMHWVPGIFDSKIKLGSFYKDCAKNYSKAIETFEQLEQLGIQSNSRKMQLAASAELAGIYQITGNYALALNNLQKTITLVNGNDALKSILANMGEIYKSLGDYEKALSCYEKALTIINDTIIADKKIPSNYLLMQSGLLITIAEIYVHINDYDKAMINYRKVLSRTSEEQNELLECLAYQGIGLCYFRNKDLDNCLVNYNHALTIASKGNIPGNEEVILNALADAYLEKGEPGKALDYSKKSLIVAKKNGNRPQMVITYTTLGRIDNYYKDYANAVKYLQKAIVLAKDMGAKNDEKTAWEVLSKTYTGMQQPAKAFEAYKNFINLRDSVYNAEKAKELTRIDMQGQFDRKQTADSVKQADEKKIANLRLQRQQVMTYSGFAGVGLMVLLAFFIYRNYSNAKKSNILITKANETIQEEKQISEELLLNILPAHVAEELKTNGSVEAKQFEHVTVLFTDFVNFTTAAELLTPGELVAELHACFKEFDEIIGKYKIEKIKTVGDAYLAVAGLPDANTNHAKDIVNAAIEIRNFMVARHNQLGQRTFGIRLGINSGSVVAGIVGVKKFAYDIWGDTVNTAARMEQNSENGKINISHSTYEIIKDKFTCTYRGEIGAKNKGMMKMYYVEGVLKRT